VSANSGAGGRYATDVEDAMATMVNLAGARWEKAKREYAAVPWWKLTLKLRLRNQLRRKDAVFEVSIELYSEFLKSR